MNTGFGSRSRKGSGPCVWELLDGERSTGAIRDILLERFDAPPEPVEAELREFFGEVEEVGIPEVKTG